MQRTGRHFKELYMPDRSPAIACASPVRRFHNKSGTIAFGLAVCFLMLAGTSQGGGEDASIWKYDFRDTFYDIHFVNPERAVIVGSRGRVLATHSSSPNLWSVRDSGTKELLTCLSFADRKNGWAAGHGGVIIHTTDGGNTWQVQRQSARQNRPLFDIEFPSQNAGYACGAGDTVLKTTDGGRTWTSVPTGVQNIYYGLAFVDEEKGYLVGEFGTVMHTTDGGSSWKQLDLGDYRYTLFGIALLTESEILVYGIAGSILRSEDGGLSWQDVSPGVQQSLFAAAMRRNEVVLAGRSGIILYSKDRGKTFEERNDEELTSFAGVCAHPERGFLCVGELGKIFSLDTSEKNEGTGAP
jgi:photosystem II stability/assembly factor-like uncharacterized protein